MKKLNGLEHLPLRRKTSNANNRLGTIDWVILVILVLFALMIIFPFYNAFLISISPQRIVDENPLLLVPKELSLEAYKYVFNKQIIWDGFKITMILLIVGTAYQLFFTVITGYALSRNNWFGKNFVMNMILVTMFFGGGLIPYYYLIINLGLYDTIWVMIIPGAIDTFNMLLMRNYFAFLPKELEESAKIDGANDFTIFLKIYLPLSLPMLATIGLFFAVGNWNSWYNASLYIEQQKLKPLQLVLKNIIAEAANQEQAVSGNVEVLDKNVKMAAIFFTIIPMMSFYPFLQKYFVKGIVVGAIKG